MTINTNNYTYSFIFDEFGTSNAVLYVTKMPIDGNVATDSTWVRRGFYNGAEFVLEHRNSNDFDIYADIDDCIKDYERVLESGFELA